MKKIFTLILLSLTLIGFAQKISPEYVDGQIFLKFKTGTIKSLNNEDPNNIRLEKIAILKDLIGKYGITKAYKPFYQADDDIKLTHILQLEFTNAAKIDRLIDELYKFNMVEYAEKVMLLKTHATPTDGFAMGAHLTQINAAGAWNTWNGTANGNSNITVAIVDNAIAINHPDLTGNVWVNPGEIAANGIDDDQNGYVDDINGWDPADGDNNPIPSNNAMDHGTHCAGIAGARTDNGIGYPSIGWNVKIIGVKCEKNTGTTTSVTYGYQGLIYAAKAKARVVSCSWGGTGAPSTSAQSIIDYVWSKGCVIFVSAGNDGLNANATVPHYPAAYNNVFSVASCATNNVKSNFSCYGTWVDITSPGENIMSCKPGGTYQSMSGTSMACPLVAGLAGLMLSKYPGMLQNDVLNCISSTAANIYTVGGNASYVTPAQLGAGRIDANAAMLCAASYTGTPPIGNFYTLTRNTCPNTAIVFKDSSYYNPTSWSWSFPGGTPATSTSSNPSITYASPGTYNVTMTVTNTNGSSVKVKNSYITIAGPINLPLVEGFQNATFLPTNWTGYNVYNDSIFWKRKQGVGGFTVNAAAACVMFNDYEEDATGDRDELRTPRFDFSNVANAKIRFDVAYKQYDNTANINAQNPYSDTLELKVTSNCGTSWTSVYNKGGATLSTSPGTVQANIFVPLATEWRTDSVNISAQAALQPNVMVSFVNRGHYGQALYLDNINIFLPAPSMSVSSPANGCTGTPVTFTNNTFGAAGYTWTANPAASISAPNGTNTSVTFTTPGTYSITLTANNGTVIASLTKTISVAIQPTVTLVTSTTNICSGTSVTLTASGASTYSWSNSATTSSIVVTPTVTTTYSVNGNNSTCFQQKVSTVNVTLTPVVSIVNQTICAAGTATLNASGASTYSWSTGSTSNPLIVSPSTNTVYTVIGFNNTCTNTKTVSVTIGSSITIVPAATTPTICTGGTVGLSATGATTYTWLPINLNTSAITVTPASSTTYTINGSNSGCNGTATISVNIISAPALVLTPNTSSICAGGNSTITASGYATYTWMPGNLNGSSNIFSPPALQVYTVTGKLGNCNGSSNATISVVGIPTVGVTGSTIICAGNSATLTASGAGTYSWSSGPTTPVVVLGPANTTTYVVTGYNSNCSNSIAVSVSVNPNPTLAVISSSNPICMGDGANLTASGATTYTWSQGGNFPTTFESPTVTTTYTVTGATNGCKSQAVFTETVNNCSGSVGLQPQTILNTGLVIYPNPANDYITISYSGKQFDYVIYDNIGRLITYDNGVMDMTKIKVRSMAKGVYYIEITCDKEKNRRKLVID